MAALFEIRKRLFQPVDVASLVAFRVFFGLLMAWDASRYVASGWIESHYVEPAFQFKFIGFTWVKTMSSFGMWAVFGAMIALGVTIAAGYFYRLSCVLFALLHTYVFLIAAEYYLNHAYLISVFVATMAFVPANRALSVDVHLRPALYSRRIPAWPLVLLCGLVVIVFVFGAVAKMNADWFAGEPVRHWLADRARDSVISPLLTHEGVVQLVANYGCFFDLLVGPLLVWRRTRLIAFFGSLAFHLSNAYLFNIGVFPWFMLAATTLFFHPSWPRSMPVYGRDIDRFLDTVGVAGSYRDEPGVVVSESRQRFIASALAFYFMLHVLVPLRHHLYPGDVAWTEEGHYFSWRMKLRHKEGRVSFRVTDPASGRSWVVDPNQHLDARQVQKMIGRPDNILQYARFLHDAYEREEGIDVQVRVDAFCALNYRPEQRFIDPDVDLAKEPYTLMPTPWILPFEDGPLPSPTPPAQSILGVIAQRLERTATLHAELGER